MTVKMHITNATLESVQLCVACACCKAICHASIVKTLTRAVVSQTPRADRLDTGTDATGPLYEAGQCSSNMRQLQNNDGVLRAPP